jgi:hypothetical protein
VRIGAAFEVRKRAFFHVIVHDPAKGASACIIHG